VWRTYVITHNSWKLVRNRILVRISSRLARQTPLTNIFAWINSVTVQVRETRLHKWPWWTNLEREPGPWVYVLFRLHQVSWWSLIFASSKMHSTQKRFKTKSFTEISITGIRPKTRTSENVLVRVSFRPNSRDLGRCSNLVKNMLTQFFKDYFKGYAENFLKTYMGGWLVGFFSKAKFFLKEKYLYNGPFCGTNF